ncbi:hypothetical protein, partial [Mesomycoplasma hyopneumoniae]|uniref:hypothetical protein n=1 Tax=Mesomycoplasma hyopneumoniae TaxID=2099 RepID=UPI00166FDA11
MLILTKETLSYDKFNEIINNINTNFNNPIWLKQDKTYFKLNTIYNLFINYYHERVIKFNSFSYFLKQLELLLIEHLPSLYTKSISHLDNIFEKMLESDF